MGIKLLNLSMIMVNPWQCFHMLSKLQRDHHQKKGMIKLVKWDGQVMIYDKPIHASELMLEFPKHMVCRSDSFFIGQKIPPLSDHDKLQLGHNYFLLPTHLFHSVLSFVTIASLASSSNSQLNHSSSSKAAFVKKAAAVSCRPFDVHKTPAGCLRIRVCEEFLSRLLTEQAEIKVEEEEEEEDNLSGNCRLCTTSQLRKDYMQLVGSRQCWKPKLNTIKESSRDKRKLASFGMIKRSSRKYSQPRISSQKNRRSETHSSKAKIKNN